MPSAELFPATSRSTVSSAPDIVVAGHICLDVIPTFLLPEGDVERAGKAPRFEPGSLIEVGAPVVATGGAVSNVGLALHRLGIRPHLIGKVGDDLFGRAVLDILRGHDPALVEGMIVEELDSTSYTVVLSPPGVDRIFLHAPGANETFRAGEVDVDEVAGSRLFHFGYPPLMEQTFADGGAALADLLAAVRARGTAVSLDMAQFDPASPAGRADWPAFLERVLPHVDIVGPSIGETLVMLGLDDGRVRNGALLAEVAGRLADLGPPVVLLKLGANGLFLHTTSDADRLAAVPGLDLGRSWRTRGLLHGCFDVEAVGTTGAGDCTLAGFLAALLKGRTPEQALRDASAVGAFSVEREDSTSGVAPWEAVQERVEGGWTQRPVAVELDGWAWNEADGVWIGPEDASR